MSNMSYFDSLSKFWVQPVVMYSPAVTFSSTVSSPENVSLMQNYLSLLFAVTVSVLTISSTAISARTALLISVEFYLTFIQTEEIILSFSPHIFIGLDLYFPHWMFHLNSAMNCSALKSCYNAELILKKVLGEPCTCLQGLENWDIILQHLSFREWLICQGTWLCLSPRLPQRHHGYGLTCSVYSSKSQEEISTLWWGQISPFPS